MPEWCRNCKGKGELPEEAGLPAMECPHCDGTGERPTTEDLRARAVQEWQQKNAGEPMDISWRMLKEGVEVPMDGVALPEPESEQRQRPMCEFCGQRLSRMWSSRIPPGRQTEEGHAGMYFRSCSECSEKRGA